MVNIITSLIDTYKITYREIKVNVEVHSQYINDPSLRAR